MSTSPTYPRIADDVLDALTARIREVRLPRLTPATAAAPGPGRSRQEALLQYWREQFDWRSWEDRIEQLGYRETTAADGRRLALLHSRAAASTGLPVLLIHGWPDSPLRFVELTPRLNAAGHDIVAPAIPGFWNSEEPEGEISRELVAADFHALMLELGYSRYAVHAGDWGAPVAQTLALQHPEAVVALHLTDVPFDLGYAVDKDTAGPAELAFLAATEKFGDEALYLIANMTQPNLISSILADTPFGLACWLGSLYDAWSETPIPDEQIIANAALMYLSGTVRSSIRLYSEPATSWDESGWGEAADGGEWDTGGDEQTSSDGEWGAGGDEQASAESGQDWAAWAPARVEVPTAFALFPADLVMAPRELAERYFAVERFTVMPRGGHFAALEEPDLLAEDLLAFLAAR